MLMLANSLSCIEDPTKLLSLYLQTNTFQGVLITDIIKSYSAFTYVCGEMEWSGQKATVGYNSNGDYFNNNPASGLEDIAQIISCRIPEGGRRKRQTAENGGEASQIPVNMEMSEELERCRSIANIDDTSFMNITELMQDNQQDFDQLPECPSTKVQLGISTEFEEFTSQEGDCHRSIAMTMTPTINRNFNFVTVCCYADNG